MMKQRERESISLKTDDEFYPKPVQGAEQRDVGTRLSGCGERGQGRRRLPGGFVLRGTLLARTARAALAQSTPRLVRRRSPLRRLWRSPPPTLHSRTATAAYSTTTSNWLES